MKRKFLLLATVQKLKGNCLRYEISDICSHLQVDKFVLELRFPAMQSQENSLPKSSSQRKVISSNEG